MNNEQILLFLTWPLMAMSGIFLYRSYEVVKAYLGQRRRRREFASLEVATKENTCHGPHAWDSIKLALAGLPVDRYRVCVDCGLISTQDQDIKLNQAGIEIYKNELRIRKEKQEKYDRALIKKVQETDNLMNSLIRRFYDQFEGETTQVKIDLLEQFFRKTVLELDCLYDRLNKELEEDIG